MNAKSKTTKQPNRAPKLGFTEADWNFLRVPDDELVVCCVWEYARESASIRDAVKIAKTAFANQRRKSAPETAERQAFREAANRAYRLLYQTGYELQFWVSLPFPKPWRLVNEAQRKKWAPPCAKISTPVIFPPFQVTGGPRVASTLYDEAKKASEARMALSLRLSQIDSGVAHLKEADELRKRLSKLDQHPTPVVVRGEGGVDSFIAQVNWHEFSKRDIKECFGRWVDAYSCPVAKPSERGHKEVDWRARLERLGLLRLRRHFTFGDAKPCMKKLYPPVPVPAEQAAAQVR